MKLSMLLQLDDYKTVKSLAITPGIPGVILFLVQDKYS